MRIFLALFYCTISISVIYAQNPEWRNYTTSNSGLPNNTIQTIAIDDSGNKWIGTDGGIAKIDGQPGRFILLQIRACLIAPYSQ